MSWCIKLKHKQVYVPFGLGCRDAELACSQQGNSIDYDLYCFEGETNLQRQIIGKPC